MYCACCFRLMGVGVHANIPSPKIKATLICAELPIKLEAEIANRITEKHVHDASFVGHKLVDLVCAADVHPQYLDDPEFGPSSIEVWYCGDQVVSLDDIKTELLSHGWREEPIGTPNIDDGQELKPTVLLSPKAVAGPFSQLV